MAKIKRKLARRAVRSTAKHTAHGTTAKLKREPMRSAALLGIGGLVGVSIGWLLGRNGSDAQADTTSVSPA